MIFYIQENDKELAECETAIASSNEITGKSDLEKIRKILLSARNLSIVYQKFL